jgi:serine/threonine protein phosphatase 1
VWNSLFSRRGKRPARVRPARVPPGTRVYAVGDVHGRADLLGRLMSRIDADLDANPVLRPVHVFLGDYIDRGPESQKVLDLLIKRRQHHETVFLKGNHEVLLEEFLRNPEIIATWRHLGGIETLLSYGIRPSFNPDATERTLLAQQFANTLPAEHRQFIENLQRSFRCGDFFFVHAGVRPGVPLSQQADEDLFWIRDKFHKTKEKFEQIIVHGHHPVDDVVFHSNRINIDTGAFATGRLSCLRIEADNVRTLDGTYVGGRRIYI